MRLLVRAAGAASAVMVTASLAAIGSGGGPAGVLGGPVRATPAATRARLTTDR